MITTYRVCLVVLTVLVFHTCMQHGARDQMSSQHHQAKCAALRAAQVQLHGGVTPGSSSLTEADLCAPGVQDDNNTAKKGPDRVTPSWAAPKCVGSMGNKPHIFRVDEKAGGGGGVERGGGGGKAGGGGPVQDFDPAHGGRVGALGQGGHTIMLSPRQSSGNNNNSNARECTYIAQHYAHHCFGVVFVANVHGGAYGSGPSTDGRVRATKIPGIPVTRFDLSVDRDGLVIDGQGSNDDIVDRTGKGSQEDQQSKGIGTLALNAGHHRPAGHFRRPPKERGFLRVQEKMSSFVSKFGGIEEELQTKLKRRGIGKGDDVVVMVVNEGETDLFLNFACSCKLHGIDMKKVLVFAGNKELVPMVEATEALGVYHPAFASVSKKASNDYLDRVFVDMMWYKAFSVYLVLRQGVNILFQDADLVWFRDPFPYFQALNGTGLTDTSVQRGKEVLGYFSDDGQRSKRFSPYFFNSGFYYLKSTERTQYFAWSIMTDFDAVQVTGSHQNVFTLRLVEGTQGFGLGAAFTQILPPFEFPNGILYHHNKKYMDRLRKQEEDPYHFHMCWTQETLIHPKGKMYNEIMTKDSGNKRSGLQWLNTSSPETESSAFVRQQCCVPTGLSKRELEQDLR